ncbi:uncharacterized protein LOC143620460 [Bidens hawaiensis]|uniref:uncharacterized protein LOC143620460 n=1 Tax=Bidens hawaiensis TaxID=980011 RepID=UPI00404B9730
MSDQAPKETSTNSTSFQCPMLTSTNYTIWAMRMKVMLKIHGVWEAVEKGTTDLKLDNIATAVLFQSIPEDQILQIGDLNTAKEMWEAIKSRNLGAERAKEAKLQTLIEEFDVMRMKDLDTINNYAAKLTRIKTKAISLGEPIEEKRLVKKFFTSLQRRFIHIVASLEQVLDLKTIGFEDVVGRLKTYEERTRDDDEPDNQSKLMFHNSESYTDRNNGESSRGRSRGSYASRDTNVVAKSEDESHQKLGLIERFKKEANMVTTNEDDPEVDGTLFMMNCIQETVYLNEGKVLPKKFKVDSSDKDAWYLDNGASNHMTGNRDYFSELNDRITGRVEVWRWIVCRD